MKILFYPEPDGANEYTSNMVNHIETVVGERLCYAPNIKDIVLRPHKTFRYKKYHNGKTTHETMSLKAEEFIRRFRRPLCFFARRPAQ